MLKYIAETHVTLSNADRWVEQICQRVAELCPSIISNGWEEGFECEEAHAIISATDIIVEGAYSQIRYSRQSAVAEVADKFLNFGDGCAIIRPTNDGLFVRISAWDLVVFYGIRTLLEGSLLKLAAIPNDAIEWFPCWT